MRTLLGLPVVVILVACGGDGATFGDPSGAGAGTSTGVGGSSASSGTASGAGGATAAAGGSDGSGASGGSGGAMTTCPRSPLPGGESQHTITHDGNERAYEVQVPASYDNTAAVPLVLDLHGYTSNKDDQQNISGWAELAELEGFVVVRPNGFGGLRSWNSGDYCCGQAQSQGLDDVGLMRAIVDEVTAALCIDPKRIFVTGLSNGGAMSHRLACEAADVFAAAAPVAYPLGFDPFDKCQPSRPIAVMHSHGTNDFVVPYNGGFSAPSTPESFAYWGAVDGCTGDPVETFTKGDSRCDTYQTCDQGVEVSLCTLDGGHLLYQNAEDVPIAELAWAFFTQHSLP
ncbi:MAG: PHB depolymerase family esterase [Polyangiaceae bacterium]